jgi:hypothetical protein
MFDTNWETLINDEPDVNNACSNFTNVFLTIAKEYIPTREVTIRTDDKMWFDSNLHRESRRRDRLRKTFLRTKTVSAKKHYKKQRNRVNNLKKQAKELFYANINENLDELKTTERICLHLTSKQGGRSLFLSFRSEIYIEQKCVFNISALSKQS